MSITDQLIAFSRATPDPAARRVMQLSVLDWAACGIAGAAEGSFAGFAGAQEPGQAQLLGGGRASPASAALVNGTLSHALDYDDTHFAHIGHPSVAVVPAALAVAQTSGLSMAELIDAALIGAEASVHVGCWLGRDHYQVGFHQTATAGAFGATLAAARLLALDPEQSRQALGLCATMASGLKSQFGTMGKPLNAGLAARTGVEAAQWSALGMTSASDGLAGPLGFGDTHHGQANPTTPGAGPWQMEHVSHKFHACCHGLHAMLEAVSDVSARVSDITAIEIDTHPRWMTVCNISRPQTGLECKFSYAQTAAMALLGHDTADISVFTDDMARDAQVSALAEKVTVTSDETLTEMQARVRVRSAADTASAFHDLAEMLPYEMRRKKVMAKAGSLVGAARASALWQACEADDLAAFVDLLG